VGGGDRWGAVVPGCMGKKEKGGGGATKLKEKSREGKTLWGVFNCEKGRGRTGGTVEVLLSARRGVGNTETLVLVFKKRNGRSPGGGRRGKKHCTTERRVLTLEYQMGNEVKNQVKD